jgi:LPS export ABC transporter permease LptG/LPS export ABC transporter permease LptF
VLPEVLPFTLQLSVLVGVLICLGRMSSDGEITGMRAAGVPGRVVMRPILLFATLAMLVTAACSLWLTPWSMRERYRVINQLIAAQLTAEIQPRVFAEQFPNRVLYVGDVITTDSAISKWRQIFMADITPADEQGPSAERGEGPRVTLATEALATPDIARNRIQLTLLNSSTHEVGKEISQYSISSSPRGDQVLEAQRRSEVKASRESVELDTGPLYKLAYKTPDVEKQKLLQARIELHQRFAMPMACVLLALVGIPLGVSSRKGGKSSAIVVTVALAFVYFIGKIGLINLAQQGALSVVVAVWLPNALFGLMGITLMLRLEVAGDRDVVGAITTWLRETMQKLRPSSRPIDIPRLRLPLLPGVVDTYVLSSFLFYFLVWLVSFVLMFHVFTFFELLSDMVKNKVPMAKMGSYLFFLTPKLIYDFTPYSVLVSILIAFGILSKHNEVTALKACGVSLYRLAVPIVLACTFLSGGLFAFDHYWVPEANRRQDALRNEIKGKPVQTYLRADRKWIFGLDSRIFYYKYFDQAENIMGGVHVYEIDPKTFTLTRHIVAEKARWEPSLKLWVFQNGWAREMKLGRVTAFHDFSGGAMPFKEITETPEYFVKEVKQSKQMNSGELEVYIRDLQKGGFDTIPLQVQYHKKFSVPVFALIMALISIPFAFFAGNRGAMTGVGLSFVISIAYGSIDKLFEQVGNLNQLPAAVAAWAPAGVFALAAMYFFARIRS